MRHLLLPVALAIAAFASSEALAATYTSDATYQFPGQTWSNSGRGIAVNSTDTRLFEVVRSSTQGSIVFLDTADGTVKGSITPATPTTINDLAVSPDGLKIYFARYNGTDWEIDAGPSADGAHTSAEVSVAVASLGSVPGGIITAQTGSTVYLAVATNSAFQIYTSASGAAFTKQTDVTLPFTTQARDVAAVDTGSGIQFYVLTPGSVPQSSVLAYAASGSPVSITWSDMPAGFSGFILDSVTSAGAVDGVPSIFLSADGSDTLGNPVLSSFRFGYNGLYQGDGFGYGFSGTAPLKDLQPMDTSPTLIPGAAVGNHLYLGAALPDTLGNAVDQTVRIVVTASTLVPGTINGTVTENDNTSVKPSVGAKVVVGGVDTPVAITDGNGNYTLNPVNPGTILLGASRYGFAATNGTEVLASGETKTAATLELPVPVPAFTLAETFAPPITDGIVYAYEYPGASMPFYTLGGGQPSAQVQTTSYVTYDADFIYVAVIGYEPSLALNRAAYGNQNMLTFDDNVQIYLDPPHRHDVQGTAKNLFQFAVNIPPMIPGQTPADPQVFERRIFADGSNAQDIPASAWWARAGYFSDGWMIEAKIAITALNPFPAPDANAIWGLLVARHRPSSHLDSLPIDYSTSSAQAIRFTDSRTWTDIKFAPLAPGAGGDVNRNGVLDAADIAYVLKMAAGLSYGTPAPGDPTSDPNPNLTIRNAVLAKGDVWPAGAKDGIITLQDATRIARAMAGLDSIP